MKLPITDANAPSVAVVIVTYASGAVLRQCLDALMAQTRRPDRIVIVDNCSPDPGYLPEVSDSIQLTVIRNPTNDGFCIANNQGYRLVRDFRYVAFLNPDAFLAADLVERAVACLEHPDYAKVGVLGGTLLGFDIVSRQPTGTIDSTGIFQKWYGKWYDRGQGDSWDPASAKMFVEDVPAITGALMFCRAKALNSVVSREGEVFDKKFFMYKEDIDLSVRLRKNGWRLVYLPSLLGYHCRGWRGRHSMSTRARYLSARNELTVSLRNRGRGIIYSLLKLLFVPWEDVGMRVMHLFSKRERA